MIYFTLLYFYNSPVKWADSSFNILWYVTVHSVCNLMCIIHCPVGSLRQSLAEIENQTNSVYKLEEQLTATVVIMPGPNQREMLTKDGHHEHTSWDVLHLINLLHQPLCQMLSLSPVMSFVCWTVLLTIETKQRPVPPWILLPDD